MAKVKQFDVLVVPIDVEYTSPLLGRILLPMAWLKLVRVIKFNLTFGNETVCCFYRLVIPYVLKGGVRCDE